MIVLRDRLRLDGRRALIAWAILWAVDTPLYSYIGGVYCSRPGMIGLVDDLPGSTVLALCGGAVLLAYYVWSGSALASTFWALHRDGSLNAVSDDGSDRETSHDYVWAVHKLDELWNRRAWVLGPLLAAALWCLLVFMPLMEGFPNLWWKANRVYYGYFLLKGLFWTYVAIRILVMEVLGAYSLYKLVNWNVLSYRGFHSDGCGGLLAIGRYRQGFLYGLAGASISLVFLAIRQHLTFPIPPDIAVLGSLNVADVAIYLMVACFVPVSFFLPIWKIHSFMKSEKSTVLAGIGRVMELELKKLSHYSPDDTEPEANQLNNLLSAMAALKRIPEWPVDTSLWRGLAGSWLSVILAPLVGTLIGSVLEKWIL